MSSSLKTRLDQIERALHWSNPPPFVLGLVATFGGTPEDYRQNGQVLTMEDLVSQDEAPETSGENK